MVKTDKVKTPKVPKVNALKGWKTLVFNGLASVVPLVSVVGEIASIPELQNIVPGAYLPYYVAGVTVGNAVLRMVTTTPVGKKY